MFLHKALLTGYETAPRREALLLPQPGLAVFGDLLGELLGVESRLKLTDSVLDYIST